MDQTWGCMLVMLLPVQATRHFLAVAKFARADEFILLGEMVFMKQATWFN